MKRQGKWFKRQRDCPRRGLSLRGFDVSVLLDKNTKVIVQGITGKAGSFHAAQMRAYGTQIVGGVTPGRGGTSWEGLPIFDTVAEAIAETQATATAIFVPAAFGADAIFE